MEDNNIQGIILSINKSNENYQILKVLTKERIIYLRAKGLDKATGKNVSQVSTGWFVDFEIIGKYSYGDNFFMKKAIALEKFEIKKDIFVSSKYLNLISYIKEPNERLFNSILLFLKTDDIKEQKNSLIIIIKHLLIVLGLSLNLSNCIICFNNKSLFSFVPDYGGMFCKEHTLVKEYTNLSILKNLYILGQNEGEYILNSFNEDVFDLLWFYLKNNTI